MGMLRVSPAARCLRPRSSRLAPSSVHPVPAWGAEAARSIRPHPAAGQDAVGFAEGDGFGGAQGGVVQAAEERFHMLPARALRADGLEEQRSLGGVGDAAAVDGLSDLGGFPLDLAERAGGQQPGSTAYPSALANTARLRRVVVAAAGLPSSRRAQAFNAADGVRLFQRGHRQGRFRDPGERARDVRGDGLAGGGGVERVVEQGRRRTAGSGNARRGRVRARVMVVRASAAERRDLAARSGHFIWL